MPQAKEVLAHWDAGAALFGRGLLVAARDRFRQCLAYAEQTGDPAQMITALNALTKVASARGDLDAALGYLHRALPLTGRPDVGREEKLRVLLNLMMVLTEMGRLEEALQYAGRCEELAIDQSDALRLVYWVNRSVLDWRRLEWASMREAADRAVRLSQEAGDVSSEVVARANRGIAYLELGDYHLAEQDLMAGLQLASQHGLAGVAYIQAEVGRLRYLQGDYQAALAAGREALGALLTDVAVLDKEEVARVSRLFGTIFSMLGQRNLALKYLNRSAAYFSQLGLRAEWERATEAIGRVLAGPVRPARSQLLNEVQQLDLLTAILDLTDDLESVDPYLRGHSERVASLATLLGEALGLSPESLTTLSYAARLHDVGMIAVDAELIHRDGPLTDAEKQRVAQHSAIGEEMLKPYGLPVAGLQAIRHHHEHWDGGGYPDGLRGEAIPVLARIIAVADVYDALTSDRSYRGALDHAAAVDELRQMAGRVLDPVFVERFLALHDI
jgi:HD-GYP domain-containing protein (c-di-GMP phosphodiesterase class II)